MTPHGSHLFAASLAILSGCEESETRLVRLPEIEHPLAFFVLANEDNSAPGLVQRVHQKSVINFTLEAGQIPTIVAFPLSFLETESIDLELLDDSRLVPRGLDCPDGKVSADGRRLDVPIDDRADLWIARNDTFETAAEPSDLDCLATLSLDGPLGLERCHRPWTLRRFGPPGGFLRNGATVCGNVVESSYFGDLRGAVRLDSDHVFTHTRAAIFVFDRDGPTTTACQSDIQAASGKPWEFDRIAVRHMPNQDERHILMLVEAGPLTNRLSGLLELAVTTTEVRFVRTATVIPSPLNDLEVREDGKIVLVGDAGLVITATGAEGPFRARRITTTLDLERLDSGRDGEIISASDGAAYTGDVFPSEFALEGFLIDPTDNLADVFAAPVRSNLDYWTSARGRLYKKTTGQPWSEAITPVLPHRAGACAVTEDGCGRFHGIDQVRAITSHSDRLLVVSGRCGGVVAYGDSCASVVGREDGSGAPPFEAPSVAGEPLTFVGENGVIYDLIDE